MSGARNEQLTITLVDDAAPRPTTPHEQAMQSTNGRGYWPIDEALRVMWPVWTARIQRGDFDHQRRGAA